MPGDHRATGFFNGAVPRILAHRGLALEAPENTLLAFLKALSAGATHIETDVHASLDGVAVLAHDPDLTRVAGRNVRVGQLTFAELRRVELGHGQSFVSLAEALDSFPEVRFNIDVKALAAADPAAQAVLEARATDRVLITSFSEDRRHRTVRQLPGVATSPSTPVAVRAVLAARAGLRALARRELADFAALQLPEHVNGVRVITRRFVRAMHEVGVEVHVWTVNEPDDMRRLLDLGVDGLVTDRCDLAVTVISGRT
ncbi:MAG TPA: glycerophosphodiester phosphodiesterase family protein [Marisediminicola sp.]|jgi:glycerophosphoryl diester phosphodiesterase|nr:glycerophosphodiester phosphodiesterase [Cryobacterium sp.]HEV7956609.1 glycerophosphodiester phosphodiesterase family protein [Marisediminicola sp.]